MSSSEDSNDKIIDALKRRLRERERQAAFLGSAADPSVHMEIEDLQEQIAHLSGETTSDTVQFAEIVNLYKENHPLDSLETLMASLNVNKIPTPSAGFFQKAPTPKTRDELSIQNFESGYAVKLFIAAQIEEFTTIKYTLQPHASGKGNSGLLAGALQTKSTGTTPVSFDQVYLSVQPDINSFAQEDDKESFTISCHLIYTETNEFYVIKTSDVDIDMPTNRFTKVLETKIFDSLPRYFPIKIQFDAPKQVDDIYVRYKQIKDKLTQRMSNGTLKIPGLLTSGSMDRLMIYSQEYESTSVSINGVRGIIAAAPIYAMQYSRQAQYTKGWRNKRTYISDLKGIMHWVGAGDRQPLLQKEEMVKTKEIK